MQKNKKQLGKIGTEEDKDSGNYKKPTKLWNKFEMWKAEQDIQAQSGDKSSKKGQKQGKAKNELRSAGELKKRHQAREKNRVKQMSKKARAKFYKKNEGKR